MKFQFDHNNHLLIATCPKSGIKHYRIPSEVWSRMCESNNKTGFFFAHIKSFFKEIEGQQSRGRPSLDGAKETSRVNVSLDKETRAKARKIGNGNVSEGLRRAVSSFTMGEKNAQ